MFKLLKVLTMLMLVIGLALAFTANVMASEVTETLKSKIVLADEVVTTQGGWIIHSFRIYAADGANAIGGLYNCDTINATSNTNLKAENAEPTQYEVSETDGITMPIEFDEGVVCIVDNGYGIIHYED